MTPDDPRHGTSAGRAKHVRDREPVCDPCRQAWNDYRLRYVKERQLGYVRMVPIDHGGAWARLDRWRRGGATYRAIAEVLGMRESHVYRIHKRIIGTVRVDTWRRITARDVDTRLLNEPTHIGTVRRARALHANGWPGIVIGRESGVCRETMKRLLRGTLVETQLATRAGIAEVYDRLWDKKPPRTKHTVRAERRAEREGWVKPMAWDDIDTDPDPVDWRYVPADRATALREFVDRGDNLTHACRALKLSPNALFNWCKNHDMRDAYRTLASREGDWNSRGRYGRKEAS